MSVQPKPHYRFEDYLAVERESRDEKYEYVAGQVLARTDASFDHNLITSTFIGILGNQAKRRDVTSVHLSLLLDQLMFERS